jgi:hypothetical protein
MRYKGDGKRIIILVSLPEECFETELARINNLKNTSALTENYNKIWSLLVVHLRVVTSFIKNNINATTIIFDNKN